MKPCIHVRPRDDKQGWAVAVFDGEVLRSNSDHLSSENASLARQVESMAMRIESLAEELAKPEDVRLRGMPDYKSRRRCDCILKRELYLCK